MRTKLNLKMYFSQLTTWVIIVCLIKLILFFFQNKVADYLEDLGLYILSPVKNNGRMKLLIVMIFVPLLFNAIQVLLFNNCLQFWVQDNFLKYKADVNNESGSKKEKILENNIQLAEENDPKKNNNEVVVQPKKEENIEKI